MGARNPDLEQKAEKKAVRLLDKWFEEVSYASEEDYRYPVDAYIYNNGRKFAVEIKSSTNNSLRITDHRYDRINREIDCHFVVLLLCPRGMMFYGEQVILKTIQRKGVCHKTFPKSLEKRSSDRELTEAIA